MIIKCSVLDKIARISSGIVGICGNSDYVIRFTFDEEWDAYETKTARFKWNGTYTDVVFTGNECPMPIVQNTYNVEIGVYAGNLHTTTSAYLPMKKSILCGSGFPADPSNDVYNQIMELLNNLEVGGVTPEQIQTAVESYLSEHPVEVSEVVKYVAQTLTDEQKQQARDNIGAGTSSFSGSYNDLSNKPTIPAVVDVTTADNGKFMRVVDGAWAAAEIATATGVSF